MLKQTFIVPFVFCVSSLGCAQTHAPVTSAQSNTKAAQAVVNGITGNARGSRDEARALRRQSDERLAAKDYNGAMELRWQMMGIRGNDQSQIGSLVGSAIQSLALDDVATVGAHLDAPSCRRFANELATFDAKAPSSAVLLRHEKASQLKVLAGLTRDPQQWQKTIADLFKNPNQQVDLKALQATPVAQIEANIERVYDQAIQEAAQPYSRQKPQVSVDPFTRTFASPSPLERFIWTRDKTQRLLVVAALRARADRMEKRPRTTPLPADPFGTGPLKEKNGLIYSIGPDGKDNGGQLTPGVASKRSDYQGDISAPVL